MSLIRKTKHYIFLLFSTCLLMGLTSWTQFSFDLPTSLYYKISWKAEFLLHTNLSIVGLVFLLALVFLINFNFSITARKWTAAVGLTAIMLFFFHWSVMLSFMPIALLLYLALMYFEKQKLVFVFLILLSMSGLAFIFTNLSLNRYSFLLLLGQLIFGYYSTVVDKFRGLTKIDPIHAWLLWFCFPAGLFTILYGYKSFSESFHKSSYSEIAPRGAYLVGLGLFQLIIIQLIQIQMFPEFSFLRNKVVTAATVNDSVLNLWIHGSKILFFFIFEQIGTINLLQGITQIFGYDVDRQIHGLWRATSFLDVWKRGSYNTRMYWINYIYMPFLLKTKNIYISDLSVWFIYGLVASVAYGGINIYYVKPDSIYEIWFTVFLKHAGMYGAASCLEMYLNKNILSQKKTSAWSKYAVRSFLFFTMYLIYIIGNEFGPNPNSTLTETINMIYRMFGAQ